MAFAIVLILLVIGSLLFHLLSPWQATEAASNWVSIDTALLITLLITGLFFVAVCLFMVIAIIRFRHKAGRRAAYQPESKKLEWWLFAVTSLGIVALLAPGLVVYDDFVRVPQEAREVEVVAQQWQWAYRFPGADGRLGRSAIKWVEPRNPFGLDPGDPAAADDVLVQGGELRLPLDQPVKVLLRSKDVLHNFYVPQIRAKMDMVPGMVSYFWFTPTRLGRYEVLCAEYCGVAHFNMRGRLIVEEAEAFEQWGGGQQTFAQSLRAAPPSAASLLDKGRQLAQNLGCLACHSLDGSANLAPTWKGLYGSTRQLADGSSLQADEAYLRESILAPQAKLVQGFPPVMVAYRLSEEELAALLALIQSLSDKAPATEHDAASPTEQGRALAASLGCLACHSLDGSAGIGPSWRGLYGSTRDFVDGSTARADAAYIEEAIRQPNAQVVQGYAAIMPALAVDAAQLEALTAFIASLAADADEAASPSP
jgi:cytochrome c oxidase subunit II